MRAIGPRSRRTGIFSMSEFTLPANSKVGEGKHWALAAPAERVKSFRIYCWDPAKNAKPQMDKFDIDRDHCRPRRLHSARGPLTRSGSMRSSTQRKWSGVALPEADLPSWALPFVLSTIAGSTDIIGFLGLNGLFTAHITGNIVVLAAHVVTGNPTIFSYILSVPVFMLVLFLTRLLAIGLERTGLTPLRPLLLLQLLLLVAFLIICVAAGPWSDSDATLAIIAGMFGVAAMAVQNALAQISLRNIPSTAVMTTNITHFMMDVGEVLASADGVAITKARGRAMRTLPVIAGFTVGCGLGAACEAAVGLWSLTLPLSLAIIAFAMGFAYKNRP
jgi:uncharacterized membrane protein YoaK (UPF0700 family)